MEDHMLAHDREAGLLHGWHLDKRVSVSHMFATLAFAFGLASWQWAEHERLTVLQKDVESHEKVDIAKDEGFLVMLDNIREKDRELLVTMNRQYSEILQRLSNIDMAVNRHLENTAAAASRSK